MIALEREIEAFRRERDRAGKEEDA
jgi:hypothetical protein